MMLAEQIIEHCAPVRQQDGFGAIMETSLRAADFLKPREGVPFNIADGVRVLLPEGFTWQTQDQADGGILVSFTGPTMRVFATKGPLSINLEATGLVVRMGAAAVQVVVLLRRFPDFTITLRLRCGD